MNNDHKGNSGNHRLMRNQVINLYCRRVVLVTAKCQSVKILRLVQRTAYQHCVVVQSTT
jgi:hypothetical protein